MQGHRQAMVIKTREGNRECLNACNTLGLMVSKHFTRITSFYHVTRHGVSSQRVRNIMGSMKSLTQEMGDEEMGPRSLQLRQKGQVIWTLFCGY